MIDFDLLNCDEYWNKSLERLLKKDNISKDSKVNLVKYSALRRADLINKLLDGTYEWSVPKKVLIKKHGTNKFRVVYIYSDLDRLVLGVLYHVLSDEYLDRICEYCYSYKEGSNTAKAIRFLNDSSIHNMYGVKLDIHAYFNSVSEDFLHKTVDELFDVDSGFKRSIELLMYDNRCEFRGNIIDEYKSLIAGTPIASFFANYCLKELDFEFYNKNKIYARYSDDIIVFNSSEKENEESLSIIKGYLDERGLEINPDKYEYFKPGDEITFLGLKLRNDGKVDISDHSKQKIKRYIHNLCKKSRKWLEINHEDYLYSASKVCRKLNNKNFKCYIEDENTFGWCHYAFRYITTEDSLREIDLYTKERLRYLKTGRNNKANFRKVSDDEFKAMRWVSLVQLYHLYKSDFDYYCEVIATI